MNLFKLLDSNNDGVLSKEELKKGFLENKLEISDLEVSTIIKNIDNNNNSNIDYSEFIMAAISRDSILNNEERLKNCFHLIDSDRNGKISKDELIEIFMRKQQIDKKLIEDLINPLDTNQDGHLDYEEFKVIIKKMITN